MHAITSSAMSGSRKYDSQLERERAQWSKKKASKREQEADAKDCNNLLFKNSHFAADLLNTLTTCANDASHNPEIPLKLGSVASRTERCKNEQFETPRKKGIQ